MKKVCFVAVLFLSKIMLSSSQESSTQLVVAVHSFLEQFRVARNFEESRENFLCRMKDNFKSVTYTEENQPGEGNERKRNVLRLFDSDICYAVKECGFWGGDEDGFYVATKTDVVGKGSAILKERGHYEWLIQFSNNLSGDEFENTPIQPLLNYLIARNESEFVVPLTPTVGVSFVKEETQIIARLKYK